MLFARVLFLSSFFFRFVFAGTATRSFCLRLVTVAPAVIRISHAEWNNNAIRSSATVISSSSSSAHTHTEQYTRVQCNTYERLIYNIKTVRELNSRNEIQIGL